MLVRRSSLQPIDFNGLQVLDYTSGSATLSSSVALIEVPSGAEHPQAWSRRSDKYYLVVRGCVEFVVGGAQATLDAGDFCHIEQGDPFSYRNATAQPATLVLVHTPSFDLRAEVFME
jgi:mannose-6-phosphate isomerase-like protein (cupin superfamily)